MIKTTSSIKKLENGLHWLEVYNPAINFASVEFTVGSGSIFDPISLSGLAHFSELCIRDGKVGKLSLSNQFDTLGVRFISLTDIMSSQFNAISTADMMKPILKKLSSALEIRSNIKHLEKVRQTALQDLISFNNNTRQRLFWQMQKTCFKDGWASPVFGQLDTIKAINESDTLMFLNNYYNPNNSTLTTISPINPSILEHWISIFWGKEYGEFKPHTLAPPDFIRQKSLEIDISLQQEQIAVAFPASSYNDNSYYESAMLTEWLGGNSASQLYKILRRENSLAYGVGAFYVPRKNHGMIVIYFSTLAKFAQQALVKTLEMIKEIEETGINKQELSHSRENLKTKLILGTESVRGLSNMLSRYYWNTHLIWDLSASLEQINKITTENMNDHISKLSPTKNIAIAAIGPLSENQLLMSLATD